MFVYLDNILVARSSAEEHLLHLRDVFCHLDAHALFNWLSVSLVWLCIVQPYYRQWQICPALDNTLQVFLGEENIFDRFTSHAALLLQLLCKEQLMNY